MSIAAARPEAERAPVCARGACARRGRFAEALAAAGAARAAGGAEAEAPARTGRGSGGAPSSTPGGRRPRTGEEAADMRPNESPPALAAPPGRPEHAAEPPGAVELRAHVRAVPAVIAASRRPGSAELALSFGAALSLDLRAGAQGLELTLRPAAGLERVTRAELPGLVEALRARGLRVARAEVRQRAPAAPRGAR